MTHKQIPDEISYYNLSEVPSWQRAVADLRVRQALLHAIDRPSLAEVETLGLAPPGDVFLAPSDAIFPELDQAIVKYPYEPGRAALLLAEVGWRRTSPDAQLTNAGGHTLDVSLWSTAGGRGEEPAVVTDYWKRAGINASYFMIPPARARDNELRTSFPGLSASARTIAPTFFVFTSQHLPTAEGRWQGANRGSFMDAEVDRLQSIVLTTRDPPEQRRATVALHQRMSEVLGFLPLYYGPELLLARANLKGPIGEYGAQQGATWNIFEWELTD